jgi:hypothetical protein
MDKFITHFTDSSFAKWCDANIDTAFQVVGAGVSYVIDACGGTTEVTSQQVDHICMNVCGAAAMAAAAVVLAPLVVIGFVARKLGWGN